MIKVYIDNQEVDVDQNTTVAITLSIGSVEDPGTSATSYTKSIKIPMTAKNRQVMKHTDQVYNKTKFNNENHSARIESNGFTTISGVVQLTSVNAIIDGSGYYNLNVIGDQYKWVSEALKKAMNKDVFPSVGINCSYINLSSIIESDSVGNVKIVPIDRNAFFEKDIAANEKGEFEMKPRKTLGLSDLTPFFRVKTMLADIFSQYGYSVVSSLMADETFNRLYFSGTFNQDDTTELSETSGFKAGQSWDNALVLTYYPNRPLSESDMLLTVPISEDTFKTKYPNYKFVDTVDSESEDDSLYNKGGFELLDAPYYKAPEDCHVSFKYSIGYISSVAFNPNASNENLHSTIMYYDRITVMGKEYSLSIPINTADSRNSINTGSYYLIRIKNYVRGWYFFEFSEPGGVTRMRIPDSGEYMFRANSDSMTVKIVEFVPLNRFVETNRFEYHVAEIPGEAMFDVEIITDPMFLRKGQAIKIETPYFSISNPDASGGYLGEKFEFTMKVTTTVESVFSRHPGLGMTITAENYIDKEVKQMDFIRALRQMYNLFIYTNPVTREVLIEPRDRFYGYNVIDWSSRIDLSKEILIEELGTDKSKTFVLRYVDGDPYIEELNKKNKTEIGVYKIDLKNAYAEEGENVISNTMFTPAATRESIAGMKLITVSQTKEEAEIADADVNFLPKIVKWVRNNPVSINLGNQSLSKYPLMVFQDITELVNLGFDDMKGVSGLHKYYDNTIEMYNHGRRITLYMALKPHNVEPFIYPNDLKQDFRAMYSLRIHGEDVYCRLESIVDYNPESGGSTKCVFVQITDKEAELLGTVDGRSIVTHQNQQIEIVR